MTERRPRAPMPDDAVAPRDVSRWRVGEIELDEATLELRRRGELVAIERKPLELLMWLLRHPGEVITKDELFDALWAGRVVTESVLTKCVAKLRQAIGDDTQAVLKTVHGFGYRLVAPVERLALDFEPPPPDRTALAPGTSPPQRPNWRLRRRFEGSRGENWLVEHAQSRELRVFKFALDAAGLSLLKREVTVNRLLRDTLGARNDLVRVLDWNLEEAPYFIELEHCAQGSLVDWLAAQGGAAAVTLATRLELVAQAADALAGAHSAGVLHKDVKPGNLMIELDAAGAPRVRLGDFGSGRVLDAERLQALEITRMGFTQTLATTGSTSGTWAYLAPEVVAGQPPTVRSDVFALGVLLYQLAVGDIRRPLAPGWERDLEDGLLREDVAACCDQDPARRLGDAAELARRLRTLPERHAQRAALEEEAAQARATRQALARARQRRGWLAGVAALASLAAFTIGGLYLQVNQARDEAQRHAEQATAVSDFLVHDLIAAANPEVAGIQDVSVRAVLDTAESQLDARFAGQPARLSALRLALAEARLGIGDHEQAAGAFEAVAGSPADAATRVAGWLGLASTRIEQSRDADAAAALDAARPLLATLDTAPPRLQLLHQMLDVGVLPRLKGQAAAAAGSLATLQPLFEQEFGAGSPETIRLLTALGAALMEQAKFDDSLVVQRRALALTEQAVGADHARSLIQRFGIAQTLRMADRREEAERAHREAFELAQRALGAEHLTTIELGQGLANTLPPAAKLVQGRALLEQLLPVAQRRFGPDHHTTQGLTNSLALILGDAGDRERERALYAELLTSQRRTIGPDHLSTLITLHNLGRSHARSQRFADALPPITEAHDRAAASMGKDHFYVCVFATQRAHVLLGLDRRDEARALIVPCADRLLQEFGPDHAYARNARTVVERL